MAVNMSCESGAVVLKSEETVQVPLAKLDIKESTSVSEETANQKANGAHQPSRLAKSLLSGPSPCEMASTEEDADAACVSQKVATDASAAAAAVQSRQNAASEMKFIASPPDDEPAPVKTATRASAKQRANPKRTARTSVDGDALTGKGKRQRIQKKANDENDGCSSTQKRQPGKNFQNMEGADDLSAGLDSLANSMGTVLKQAYCILSADEKNKNRNAFNVQSIDPEVVCVCMNRFLQMCVDAARRSADNGRSTPRSFDF